ncbi:MAG TPA: DUF2911 domain-containing protein [Thermoanaerobaculia bacterium]|nr:DUF2911 domain-containing protein [Thermoanaerobaculia bacterium]
MKAYFALALVLSLLLLTPAVQAEAPRIPWVSPASKVGLTIGITDVEIVYNRPAVKGRTIWGGLVPYGEVWRMGANAATTLSFSTPVQVAGQEVPAGTYALFAIPGKEKWTLILNRQAKQWGAYFHKPEEDQLRFEVTPRPGAETEWMAFTLTPKGPDAAVAEMDWAGLRVPFEIKVDVEKMVWANIDAALADNPGFDTYLTAYNYARDTGKRLDEAMGWIDKSMALRESFWAHEAKARLLERQGQRAEALEHLEKAMTLAKGKAPQAYVDNLDKLKAEWKAKG